MRVGILGASGFIASHLITKLSDSDAKIFAFSRLRPDLVNVNYEWIGISDLILEEEFDWLNHSKLDVLIDCSDPPSFKTTSDMDAHIQSKCRLFRASVERNIKRYIYLSSVKAAAEFSNDLISEETKACPLTAYGEMKYQVEMHLKSLAVDLGQKPIIVRLPMVYGKDGGKSILKLARLINLRVPLPLKNTTNLRSMVSISNLCEFLRILISHPNAHKQDWFVSDARPMLISEIIFHIGKCQSIDPVLFSFPQPLLKKLFSLIGLKNYSYSLLMSLAVDDSCSRVMLGWQPSEFDAKDFCDCLYGI